jgi:hypothetical protein
MAPYQATLQDLDARIANAKHRLLEAQSELAELQSLGQPTRAVEVGISLLKDTLVSMEQLRGILEGYAAADKTRKR